MMALVVNHWFIIALCRSREFSTRELGLLQVLMVGLYMLAAYGH